MTSANATQTRQPRMPIEVRRKQVLDAALHLITEQGYGAASMEAIAREVGIAKPVVYNAFGGREPLLLALLEREQARALGALRAALPPVTGEAKFANELRVWLRTLAGVIAASHGPWRLILITPAATPGLVRRRVEEGRELALFQVRSLIEPLLQHRPSLGLDPELTAHSVLAMAEQSAKLLISDPDAYTPERVVGFSDALLRALDAASRAQ